MNRPHLNFLGVSVLVHGLALALAVATGFLRAPAPAPHPPRISVSLAAPPAPAPTPAPTPAPPQPRPVRAAPRAAPKTVPHPVAAPQPLPVPSRVIESAGPPLATDMPAPAPAPVRTVSAPSGPAAPPGAETPPAAGGHAARDYFGLILARLEQVKRYPPEARQDGREGTVVVRFVLDRAGGLLDWRIEKSSGLNALDREAADMVRKATPFPPFPESITRNQLVLVVPVTFSLRQG